MHSLHDPNLTTRPPQEPVPAKMHGTMLGDIYSRMARMNDGPRHAELRAIVDRILASWNLSEVDRIARTYAQCHAEVECHPEVSKDPEASKGARICALTAAELIGIQNPQAHLEDILAFANAVAFDADPSAIDRGINAAPRLRALIPNIHDEDAAANLLGFLFQTTAATARLIQLKLENKDEPPAPFTRRWPREGGDVILVSLADKDLRFGAGPHQCPGRAIAETIANAAVDEIRSAANA